MRIWLYRICLLGIMCTFVMADVEAAKHPEGAVVAADFTYQDVSLGALEEEAVEHFGVPSFTKDVSVYGIRVKYLVYGNRLQIGVSVRTGQVVDFLITDKKYKARDGVTRGATRHKIIQTYGNVKREFLDGKVYYIYPNPEVQREKLLIEGDVEEGFLRSVRITALPITVEEADAWAEEDETFNESGLFEPKMEEKEIPYGVLGKNSNQPTLTWS